MEAAVFLTLFILFYIAMMDLIQIAKAQVLLQYSINETAKTVSVYSYVLTKAGITEKRMGTSKRAAGIQEIVTEIEKVSSALTSGDMEGAYNGANSAATKIKAIDTEELPNDILSYIKTVVTDKIDDAVLEAIVKSEVEKQIDMMSNKGADQFLKDLGISEGLEGLSFEGSSWANSGDSIDGLPVLKVMVTYTIDVHLGYLELKPIEYTLCAKTAIW